MTNSTDKLLTTTQAAQYLNLSPNSLNQWRNLKKGPLFIKLGKAVRYSTRELDAYLEQGVRQGTSRQNLQTY
jgi:excisionase family DNA binding protein